MSKKFLLAVMIALTGIVIALGIPLYLEKFAPTAAVPASDKADASRETVLDIATFTADNGIEVWLVEDHSVPVISLQFSFDGGLLYDPEDKPGVGRLVSILLDEGAGDLDSQTFQKELNALSIQMRFTAGRDALYGELTTLTRNKQRAFELLTLALTQPHFDEDAITRMKNANIADIKHNLEDPSWLSARAFNGMLFQGHPYAQPGHGHLQSMASITRDDLIAFTHKQFAQNILKVAIAGDITQEEATALVNKTFGTLPAAAAPLDIPNTPVHNQGKTILLPAESAQTFIAVANEGITQQHPDWYAASIMNYILGGGGFDSRLMEEIRKKRGLTYGVYSSLTPMKHAQIIRAGLSAGNDKAAEALEVLKTEWAKMAETGVTPQELESAQSYLTGSLLLQLTSTGQIASVMNGLQQERLSPDYLNRYRRNIHAVTQEDVRRVAKTLLRPEALAVVLTGKPENITPDITLTTVPGMEETK